MTRTQKIGGKTMEITNLYRAFSTEPWLLPQSHFSRMQDILDIKMTEDKIEMLTEVIGKTSSPKGSDLSPEVKDGVLIFPIVGTLVPKASWLDTACGFVSSIKAMEEFKSYLGRGNFEKIVLFIDSPGGAFTGLMEFAEVIMDAANEYDICAYTNNNMCSGGYLLGAATGHVVASKTASVGSVGVYSQFVKAKAGEDDGYEVVTVQAGSKKTYGSPHTEITQEEIDHFQAHVNLIYDAFVGVVTDNRNVTTEDVKSTEGSHIEALFDENNIFVDDICNSLEELLAQI